jgi:drug/metabolite transporter (DMT)-like permease
MGFTLNLHMQNKQLSYLLIPLLACIWGSSFILMKRGMFDANQVIVFSAEQVASIRISLAGGVFIPFFPALVRKLIQKKDLLYFSVVGLCGNLIPAFLFTYAEQTLDSGIAGIMNSFTPIFTILVGVMLFGTRITKYQLFGTLIGFAGISWLIMLSSPVKSGFQLTPALAILFATLLYGVSLNTIKHKLSLYNPFEIATGGFSIAFLPALFFFFFFDTTRVFNQNPQATQSFTYILILGLVGTAFAVILFNRIIAQTTAIAASTVTYFIPIIAVAIGIYNGERFAWQQLIAMLVIITGVVIVNVNWAKSNKKDQIA